MEGVLMIHHRLSFATLLFLFLGTLGQAQESKWQALPPAGSPPQQIPTQQGAPQQIPTQQVGQQQTPTQQVAPQQIVSQDVTPIGSEARGALEQTGKLDQTGGQVWREYDIRSFTSRLSGQEKPEQAVIDWILRETGTSTWFGEPMGLLSANREVV